MADLTSIAEALKGVTSQDLRALADTLDDNAKAEAPTATTDATTDSEPTATESTGEKVEKVATTVGSDVIKELLDALNLSGVASQAEVVARWVAKHF